jgi:hypothetical protein
MRPSLPLLMLALPLWLPACGGGDSAPLPVSYVGHVTKSWPAERVGSDVKCWATFSGEGQTDSHVLKVAPAECPFRVGREARVTVEVPDGGVREVLLVLWMEGP